MLNRVYAWNQTTDAWSASDQVTSGSIVEVQGSEQNFAFRVGNRAYVASAADSDWYASSSYSGFQELVGSCLNFGVRLSGSVHTYADASHSWSSSSISGVSDLVASPLAVCTVESCDDADACTIDSCNPELGCSHEPILLCGTGVPAVSDLGRTLLAVLMLGAAAVWRHPVRRRD